MISYSEGSAVGDADGKVGKDGEEAVGGAVLEGQVVGDFVDGEEEVLVGRGADNVGNGPEFERPKGRRLEIDGEGDLKGDDASDDVFGQRLGATELCDLGSGKCQQVGRYKFL